MTLIVIGELLALSLNKISNVRTTLKTARLISILFNSVQISQGTRNRFGILPLLDILATG